MHLEDLVRILPDDRLIKIAANKPDIVDWGYISSLEGKLSEELIEKNANRVYWRDISRYQKLSEPFIHKFRDKVDWIEILKHQNVSKEFVKKHAEYIDWDKISE